MNRRIAGIVVPAHVWAQALYDRHVMPELIKTPDVQAKTYGGRIESYDDPAPSRGREEGGRPIFDTLSVIRSYIFWVIKD